MASDSKIPEAVRQFVHECLPSAAYLEALLLLAGSTVGRKAETGWSAVEVSAELRSEPNLMAAALAALQEAGLLTADDAADDSSNGSGGGPRYRYAPESETQRNTVAALAALYGERRHSILTLIYERPAASGPAPPAASPPPPPARPDPIRAFSDAFRIVDRKKDGEDT